MICLGYKVLLRYEGYKSSECSFDFWHNFASSDLHPVGWCAHHGKPLVPPKQLQVCIIFSSLKHGKLLTKFYKPPRFCAAFFSSAKLLCSKNTVSIYSFSSFVLPVLSRIEKKTGNHFWWSVWLGRELCRRIGVIKWSKRSKSAALLNPVTVLNSLTECIRIGQVIISYYLIFVIGY